jgi:hypothetical protein
MILGMTEGQGARVLPLEPALVTLRLLLTQAHNQLEKLPWERWRGNKHREFVAVLSEGCRYFAERRDQIAGNS